jgi:hypothetical protein
MTAGRYGKWNESWRLESGVQNIRDQRLEIGGHRPKDPPEEPEDGRP